MAPRRSALPPSLYAAAIFGFIFLPVVVLVLFSLQGDVIPDSALQRPVAALV